MIDSTFMSELLFFLRLHDKVDRSAIIIAQGNIARVLVISASTESHIVPDSGGASEVIHSNRATHCIGQTIARRLESHLIIEEACDLRGRRRDVNWIGAYPRSSLTTEFPIPRNDVRYDGLTSFRLRQGSCPNTLRRSWFSASDRHEERPEVSDEREASSTSVVASAGQRPSARDRVRYRPHDHAV